MKWRGHKQVALASLRVDAPDIRKRTKAAHVADLAQSIRDSGDDLIHDLTVRTSDKRLVCGRDRFAALTILKAKKVWIHLVDCNDQEAKELELRENAHRRADNRGALIAELVALKEQQIRAEIELTHGSLRGQRAPSEQSVIGASADPETRAGARAVKAEARKQAARDTGISPHSAAAAERRAAEPSPDDVAVQAVPESAPTLDLLGCDDNSARTVCKFARKDQEAIDEADKYLQLAQRALAGMAPGAQQQELHADVHRVASRVRSRRPEFLCPWCKGLPKTTIASCRPCGGMGYVPAEVAERAERALREGPPMVALDGVFYPYEEVRDGKLPATNGKAKAAYVGGVCGKCGAPNGTSDRRNCEQCQGGPNHKKAKHISVQDEAGNEIPLDADEAY